MTRLEILAVPGIGDIRPGADLAGVIVAAAPWLRDHDVLVVTSKIVSKAEGQLVDLPVEGPGREAAREEILAAQTARTVARRGPTRIVVTHHGFVMASAGIDASNVQPSHLVLLPKDPDASARALRAALRDRFGRDVAVVVSDTMGRAWRNGLTDVALGAAGIDPVRDYRGQTDPYGNELHITQMAVIDELASAAELVKGKCDGIPVAVVRGYLTPAGPGHGRATAAEPSRPDGPGAVALVRDAEHDLFSLGTAEARALGLRDAADLADATGFAATPVDPAVVERAVASIATSPGSRLSLADPGPALPPHTAQAVRCALTNAADTNPALTNPALTNAANTANADPATVAALVALGADVHRLRCALAAQGLATAFVPDPSGGGVLAVGAPA